MDRFLTRGFLPCLLFLAMVLTACGTAAQPAATMTPVPIQTMPAATATVIPSTSTPVPSTPTAVPSAPTAAPSRAHMVTAIDTVALPAGESAFAAYLAPDGTRIAWTDRTQVCIATSAGVQERCATGPRSIEANSIRWSPDSIRVTFTEDFFHYLHEPDIWVLDARSGALADLTDDGVTDAGVATLHTKTVDTLPCWSRDGTQILFLRGAPEEKATYEDVYTIAANGGTPVRLGRLNATGFAPTTLDWSPDGKELVYNVGLGVSDSQYGVWIAKVDGSAARRMLKPQAPIANATFSADGAYIAAVVLNADSGAPGARPETTIIRVRDSATVVVDASDTPLWGAWTPTGYGFAYTVVDTRDPNRSGLYLIDHVGMPGRMIAPGQFAPPARGAPWRSFAWAANDTLLLFQDGSTPVLLHLGT
jgi:hypothetical protein